MGFQALIQNEDTLLVISILSLVAATLCLAFGIFFILKSHTVASLLALFKVSDRAGYNLEIENVKNASNTVRTLWICISSLLFITILFLLYNGVVAYRLHREFKAKWKNSNLNSRKDNKFHRITNEKLDFVSNLPLPNHQDAYI
uniref:Uncharacterized protein n=1 Tax=Lepeophtheirus salmonis TaxID=72036 RepID=A0A0K2UPR2_LEPSM